MASRKATSGASSWQRNTTPVSRRLPNGTSRRQPAFTRWRNVSGSAYVNGWSSGTGRLTSQYRYEPSGKSQDSASPYGVIRNTVPRFELPPALVVPYKIPSALSANPPSGVAPSGPIKVCSTLYTHGSPAEAGGNNANSVPKSPFTRPPTLVAPYSAPDRSTSPPRGS